MAASHASTGVTCTVCGKTLSRKADLPRHMRTHAQNKEAFMHRCDYPGCDYKSLQRSNLLTHMNTHTGQRPNKCPTAGCDYTTSDPGSLTRHRKAIHGYEPKAYPVVRPSNAARGAARRQQRASPYGASSSSSSSSLCSRGSSTDPSYDVFNCTLSETAEMVYQTCLRFLLHRLVPSSPSSHHPPILENLASSLAMAACSACLRDGTFSTAIELLEQGHDIFWSALLRLRSPLDDVIASGQNGEMLAQSFMQLPPLIHSLPDIFDDLTDRYNRASKLNSRLQNIVSDIRMLPGLSRFLEPLLFSDLQEAASRGAVVIVNASQYSCDALIVLHHRDPIHVPLKTTKAHVAELASRLRSLPAISETGDRTEAVILALRDLWSLVVSPTAEVLQKFQPIQSRIWWYPTAEFSLLPLHAAGPYEEGQPNFTDLYISSYTPTLMELMRARWKSLSYPITAQPHFVAVDTALPDAAEDGRDFAESELAPLTRRIAPLAMTTRIKGQDSKVARVAEALGKNEFFHITCSAIANPQRPFESSLVLSDGHLKMEEIMRLDLQQAKFAFLSTSHTIAGDAQSSGSPETGEMVHIAAAIQCAGFPSVVGPIWAVDPMLARVMAARFYENMVGDNLKSRRLAHTRAALALHRTITSCTEIPLDQRIMWLHMGI